MKLTLVTCLDYADMQSRDPEDRPANITVGAGRAILANRLSHFLNIKGPRFVGSTDTLDGVLSELIVSQYDN